MGHGLVAGAAAGALALGMVVVAPGAALAAPGDASGTALSIQLAGNVLGAAVVGTSVVAGQAVAPAGGGTATSAPVTVGAIVGTGTTGNAGVASATATRGTDQSSATSQLTSLALDALGIPAVSAGVATATVTCTAGAGGTSGDATVTGLSLLGAAPVDINAANPTAAVTVGVPVTTPITGVTGANLTATAARSVVLSPTAASATAVTVNLVLHATVVSTTLPIDIPLGTVTLAQAQCEVPPAVATSLAPGSGPTSGGTPVVVTGTGFAGTTAVTVGGVPATGVVAAPDGTSVSFVTPPAAAAGAQPVVVTRPAGAVGVGTFAYVAPTITAVTPSQGPAAGAQTVVITGTGLQATTGVTFDGVAATVTAVDPGGTSLTVVTPAHAAGIVDVAAILPGADAVAPASYAFLAPGVATIASLTPTSGPASGGQTVTITGTGLATTTGVTFGGAPATIVGTPTDTTLVVTTPPHAIGPVTVTVTNAVGPSPAPNAYRYLDDGSGATFTGLTPTTGPTTGGTTVTITGTGLQNATGVSFGGVPGTNVTVAPGGTSITVVTPASETAGPVPVAVTFPGGTRQAGTFAYVGPAVSGVTPAAGATTGGTLVTLTGSGLGGATEVLFGGVPGTGLTVAPDGMSLTVTAPAHAAGAVDLQVVLPGEDAVVPGGFTYAVAPSVTGITPASGPTVGGQTVIITGTGFQPGATVVTFGGVRSPNVRVLSSRVLLAVTPEGDPGQTPVAVEVGGVGSGVLAYVYDPDAAVLGAPDVTGISPASGPTRGGTSVAVTGSGFVPGQTSVFVCGTLIPAGSVRVSADGTALRFVAPACSARTSDVLVITPGGTDAAAFTYRVASGSGRLAATGAEGTEQIPWSAGTLILFGGLMLAGARVVRRRLV